jgi:hypothetical protein
LPSTPAPQWRPSGFLSRKILAVPARAAGRPEEGYPSMTVRHYPSNRGLTTEFCPVWWQYHTSMRQFQNLSGLQIRNAVTRNAAMVWTALLQMIASTTTISAHPSRG